MTADLRLGDWREVLSDVTCDALITDAPYSDRTHLGQRSADRDGPRRAIDYLCIDRTYVASFVDQWRPRVRHWWVVFGDHITCGWWLHAMAEAGLYTFAPVIWAKRGAAPRMTGDGPASQVEHIAVARLHGQWATRPPWGALPGWYEATQVKARGGDTVPKQIIGQKPLSLMRALVRDYSRRGWTICDPHAGSGTTLIAARQEGRESIGSEIDPATYEIARKRLDEGYTPDMFARSVS